MVVRKIILGSTSTHKLKALRTACQKAELLHVESMTGIETDSGQFEQPVSFENTFQGALNRAQSVQSQTNADISVGIESGIVFMNYERNIVLDIAVVVLLTKEGRQIVTTSVGIEFPFKYVETTFKRGIRKHTVGSVIAKKLGSDPTDPHAALTGGKITRQELLVDALVAAFKQL